MPIALSPDETRPFWLKSDEHHPIDKRPVFFCKAPTRKVMREYKLLMDQAVAIGKGDEAYKFLVDAIMLGVTGWKNMADLPFSRESLDDLLVSDEKQELAFGWPDAFKMNEAERTGFTPPPQSDAVPSASAVETQPPASV